MPPPTQPGQPVLLAFQKTKDRFLEVKMQSSRERFFHLLSDVAYIEVSGSGPCRGAAWTQGEAVLCPGAVVTDDHKPGLPATKETCSLAILEDGSLKAGARQGRVPPEALRPSARGLC